MDFFSHGREVGCDARQLQFGIKCLLAKFHRGPPNRFVREPRIDGGPGHFNA